MLFLMTFVVFNTSVVAKEYLNVKDHLNINTLAKKKANDTNSGTEEPGVYEYIVQFIDGIGQLLRVAVESLAGCDTTTTTTKGSGSTNGSTTTTKASGCPYGLSEYSTGGSTYCVVNNYMAPINEGMEKQKDHKSEGDECCNCYVAAYYKRVIGLNVSKQYWGLKKPCNCDKSGLGGHGTDLNGAFDSVANNNVPAIFHVESKVKHYVLVIGIKKSSYGNNNSRSLDDFLVMDVYDQSIYNASSRIPYYGGFYYWTLLDVQYK